MGYRDRSRSSAEHGDMSRSVAVDCSCHLRHVRGDSSDFRPFAINRGRPRLIVVCRGLSRLTTAVTYGILSEEQPCMGYRDQPRSTAAYRVVSRPDAVDSSCHLRLDRVYSSHGWAFAIDRGREQNIAICRGPSRLSAAVTCGLPEETATIYDPSRSTAVDRGSSRCVAVSRG